jgi:hypothetical protein
MLSAETLWAREAYILFAMVILDISATSFVIPASSPVIPAKAGIHCTRISTPSTTTDLLDYL